MRYRCLSKLLFAIPLPICAVLFLGACVLQPIRPDSPESEPPRPPAAYPDAMGGVADIALLSGMDDALACLAGGHPVFAVVQQNANVRNRPQREGCHLGRVPAGALVRVDAIFGQGEEFPYAALNRSTPWIPISTPGFEEDVQPIFEENCGACHSSVVKQAELQVTEYDPLMAGGQSGSVVTLGDPEASKLWTQIRSDAMPLVGELSDDDKALIYNWIAAGAARQGSDPVRSSSMWLRLEDGEVTWASHNCAENGGTVPYISAQLVLPASCAAVPDAGQLAAYLPVEPTPTAAPTPASTPTPAQAAENGSNATAGSAGGNTEESDVVRPSSVAADSIGIHAAPLNLAAPSESDPWLVPLGGFCAEQVLALELQDRHSITALTFAPDGRLFIALDIPSTGDFDPNIQFDPYHPWPLDRHLA